MNLQQYLIPHFKGITDFALEFFKINAFLAGLFLNKILLSYRFQTSKVTPQAVYFDLKCFIIVDTQIGISVFFSFVLVELFILVKFL